MKKLLFFFSLVVMPFTGAAAFTDVAGTPAHEAVQFLADRDVVQGFDDNSFQPEKDVTRAEFLKIALESKQQVSSECEGENAFSDVPADEWFFRYVCYGANNGIINGYDDGTFRPHDSVNYRDAAKIISILYEIDVPVAGAEWYSGYIEALSRERIVPGSIRETGQLISRGEMSQVVWGILTGNEVENDSLGELPKLVSCDELQAQIEKFEKRHTGYSLGEDRYFKGMVDDGFAPMPAMAELDTAESASREESSEPTSGAAADDYSGTNVQEEGVDEADIIKNDGSHIFLIRGNTVKIIRAYPPEEMRVDATIALNEVYPTEMYVDGDRLTIISNTGQYVYPYGMEAREETMMYPGPWPGVSETRIDVYDIADRQNPVSFRTVTLEGSYVSSRRIDDAVYVATDKRWAFTGYPRPLPEADILPKMTDTAFEDEEFAVRCPDIHYVPNFVEPDYLILAAIDTRSNEKQVEREAVLGAGSQVYASAENFYVTRTVWELPAKEFAARSEENTEIYRFSLDGTDIAFAGKGKAEGRVLNQFSMSENGDYFRIVTQTGEAWQSDKPSESRVTILGRDLKKRSEITGIAPGENLKSARFVGDRAYLVTFKTVDPLFVIDLDPGNPKILGKLKIPGWSDYLHPYDENHLIGFGKEVDESIDADKVHSDNAVYYTAVLGMKLSLFDVTDPENPIETHKTVIGSRGTTSEVLTNHKALLWDKEKGILGFPITVTENKNGKTGSDADIQTVFAGAYVFDLDPEKGFALRGEVSHYDDDEFYLKSGEYFYGDPELTVNRIIYIGENFFSVSPGLVKALEWNDLGEENQLQISNDE